MDALQLACSSTSPSSSNYKNFDSIAIGEYEVLEFSIAETKYGKKIKVKTAEFYCYLPERFAAFLTHEEQIEEINKVPLIMRFNGKNPKRQNRIDLQFIPMNESQSMFVDLLTMLQAKMDQLNIE